MFFVAYFVLKANGGCILHIRKGTCQARVVHNMYLLECQIRPQNWTNIVTLNHLQNENIKILK